MLRTFQQSWSFLSRRERRQWAGLVPLAVLAAGVETVGAAAVFGLIKIISNPDSAKDLPLASGLYAALPRHDRQTVIVAMTVCVALLYIFKNLLQALVASVQSKVAADSVASLSGRMLGTYLAAPYTFHLRRNSAELIRNTTETVDATFRLVMAPAVTVLVEALIIAGILAVLLVTAPLLTLIALGVLVAALAALLRLTRQTLIGWGTQEHALTGTTRQQLQETFSALKEVKLRGREAFFRDAFAAAQRRLASVRFFSATLSTLSRLLIETVFICGMLLVIVLVTWRGSPSAAVVPLLGLYAYAGFRIIPSINRILMHLNSIRYGSAGVDQLYQDFHMSTAPPPARQSLEAVTFRDSLVLSGVSYRYDGRPEPVLQDVTLTIRRGESIGIVGPTGAGKSTLTDLILGLLEPSEGRITVDGTDIAQAGRAWQRKIGYVPQAVYLTDDTLRRNIAFGLAEAEIDAEQVETAVRLAQLYDWVAALPAGLDTVVGERGGRLSGGERQRIAIARALYHQPELLVFDEATSALDAHTEHALTQAIEALHGKLTLVIIAHRLSTVRGCDRLVFLRQGHISGVGPFDELLARNADFRALVSVANAGDLGIRR